MAIDEAILAAVSAGDQPPTLRLYAWQPPCVSLGYGQRVRDVDLERLQQFGWGLVRRPTGGRAILHTDELTYSVSLPLDHPAAEGGILESYRRISDALKLGLSMLGVQVEAERQDPNAEASHGAVCFDTPSHYEITVSGRKLVGSAQVRRKLGMLQHGTVPLHGDLARLCEALSYEDEAARERDRALVRSRALTLSEALGYEPGWQDAADAVVRGFESAFGITFDSQSLSQAERAHADNIRGEMYGSTAWTMRR